MFGIKRVRNVFRRYGYDVNRYGTTKLLQAYKIDQVFDVGANIGNYGVGLRDQGYVGEIFSFEPLTDAFSKLEARARGDNKWTAVNAGLGSEDAKAVIKVAGNSESSSLLNMLDRHLDACPESQYIDEEEINLLTLGSVISRFTRDTNRLFVKIDTQGYERQVLEGMGAQGSNVLGLQLEMSLVPLYEGEFTVGPMLEYIRDLGFTLMSVEPGYSDRRNGQMLQLDGIFFREEVQK